MVRALSERLVEGGHQVGIAHGVRSRTPASTRQEISPTVAVYPLPWTRRTVRAQVTAACATRRVVNRWRPDIVHLHSSFAGVVGGAVLGGGRVPLVYSPHAYSFTMAGGSPLRNRAYRALERLVARRTTVIGAVSPSEARLARDEVGARRVMMVENGIPELDSPRAPRAQQRARPLVVALGRTSAQRRPEACARILSQVSDLAEVRWIGGGAADSQGIAALQSAGVPVTGWLDRSAALELLVEATVYLHWTAWDGHPLSVLEAIAEDVVVVASGIEPNRDLLGPAQTPKSESEAVAMIRRVLTDEGERSRLLTAQRERGARLGADRMAREWESLYRGLVDEAAARTGTRPPLPAPA